MLYTDGTFPVSQFSGFYAELEALVEVGDCPPLANLLLSHGVCTPTEAHDEQPRYFDLHLPSGPYDFTNTRSFNGGAARAAERTESHAHFMAAEEVVQLFDGCNKKQLKAAHPAAHRALKLAKSFPPEQVVVFNFYELGFTPEF